MNLILYKLKKYKMPKAKAVIKLHIEAGKATPAPPVGPALAQHGVNMAQFCQEFNDRTKEKVGFLVPVHIYVYEGGKYEFITKEPPAAQLLLKEAGIEKGAGDRKKKKAGSITKEQLRAVTEKKMVDLNTDDIEAGMRIVEGTAKNMGIEIK